MAALRETLFEVVTNAFQTASQFDSCFDTSDSRSSCGDNLTNNDFDSTYSLLSDAPFFKQEFQEEPLCNLEFSNHYLIGWTEKHPQDWTSENVLDWICTVDCHKQDGLSTVQVDNFRNTDGQQLCKMTKNEFLEKDSDNGSHLYSLLADLLREYQIFSFTDFSGSDDFKDFLNIDCDNLNEDSPSVLPNISSFISPCSSEVDYYSCTPYIFTPPSTPPKSILCPQKAFDHNCELTKSFNAKGLKESSRSSHEVLNNNNNNNNNSISKNNRTRKQKKSDCNDTGKKHLVKRPKKTKATHLWKFMRSLLDDPTYNPAYIKWENKEKGVFRIVPGQSKNIAKLWGMIKNNPTMTFDKLSRSLRWCREYGFLSKVPSNEGFPKKLCFRFGDRAMDWNGN